MEFQCKRASVNFFRFGRLWCFVLLMLMAVPCSAFEFIEYCRNRPTTWDSDTVTFRPILDSFPAGSAARTSLLVARNGWNSEAPNTDFRFNFVDQVGTNFTSADGVNNIAIVDDFNFPPGALAVTLLRTNRGCRLFSRRPSIAEADILFNQDIAWDHDPSPEDAAPCLAQGPCNISFPLVALHEMGHGLGLDHENGTLGTMDAIYPGAGPTGNSNLVQPHADDLAGNVAGYGLVPTSGPWQRSIAASAYRRSGSGRSEPIARFSFDRGVFENVGFTVENRSPRTENNVNVRFYLSSDRTISPSDLYLGAVTLNMPGFETASMTTNVTIPPSVTPGPYYFGYMTVAGSLIDAVSYRETTHVTSNTPPVACFSSSPLLGTKPLPVTFDGSCSFDPDGSIVSYSWDLGNGLTRTGTNFTYTYHQSGNYFVTLTVTDNQGVSRTFIEMVQVLRPCPPGEPCDPV